MPDNCNPKDCPVSARVDAMEKEFTRYRESSSDTHAKMFDRIRALETSSAVQAEQYKAILDKLDGVEEKVDGVGEKVTALEAKPAKRWESLVGTVIAAIVAAIIGFVAARIGLS